MLRPKAEASRFALVGAFYATNEMLRSFLAQHDNSDSFIVCRAVRRAFSPQQIPLVDAPYHFFDLRLLHR